MADIDPRQVVRRGYDRVAERYATWVAGGPIDTATVQYLRMLADRLPARAHVLDLGCGRGDRLRHISDRFMLTGVDISFAQLRRAREVLRRARLVQADITCLEFPSASFDAVISLYAFNHLPFGQLSTVLGYTARWIKPGGLTPRQHGEQAQLRHVEANWLGVRMYFSGYDVSTSRDLVHAAGLCVENAGVETVWGLLTAARNQPGFSGSSPTHRIPDAQGWCGCRARQPHLVFGCICALHREHNRRAMQTKPRFPYRR